MQRSPSPAPPRDVLMSPSPTHSNVRSSLSQARSPSGSLLPGPGKKRGAPPPLSPVLHDSVSAGTNTGAAKGPSHLTRQLSPSARPPVTTSPLDIPATSPAFSSATPTPLHQQQYQQLQLQPQRQHSMLTSSHSRHHPRSGNSGHHHSIDSRADVPRSLTHHSSTASVMKSPLSAASFTGGKPTKAQQRQIDGQLSYQEIAKVVEKQFQVQISELQREVARLSDDAASNGGRYVERQLREKDDTIALLRTELELMHRKGVLHNATYAIASVVPHEQQSYQHDDHHHHPHHHGDDLVRDYLPASLSTKQSPHHAHHQSPHMYPNASSHTNSAAEGQPGITEGSVSSTAFGSGAGGAQLGDLHRQTSGSHPPGHAHQTDDTEASAAVRPNDNGPAHGSTPSSELGRVPSFTAGDHSVRSGDHHDNDSPAKIIAAGQNTSSPDEVLRPEKYPGDGPGAHHHHQDPDGFRTQQGLVALPAALVNVGDQAVSEVGSRSMSLIGAALGDATTPVASTSASSRGSKASTPQHGLSGAGHGPHHQSTSSQLPHHYQQHHQQGFHQRQANPLPGQHPHGQHQHAQNVGLEGSTRFGKAHGGSSRRRDSMVRLESPPSRGPPHHHHPPAAMADRHQGQQQQQQHQAQQSHQSYQGHQGYSQPLSRGKVGTATSSNEGGLVSIAGPGSSVGATSGLFGLGTMTFGAQSSKGAAAFGAPPGTAQTMLTNAGLSVYGSLGESTTSQLQWSPARSGVGGGDVSGAAGSEGQLQRNPTMTLQQQQLQEFKDQRIARQQLQLTNASMHSPRLGKTTTAAVSPHHVVLSPQFSGGAKGGGHHVHHLSPIIVGSHDDIPIFELRLRNDVLEKKVISLKTKLREVSLRLKRNDEERALVLKGHHALSMQVLTTEDIVATIREDAIRAIAAADAKTAAAEQSRAETVEKLEEAYRRAVEVSRQFDKKLADRDAMHAEREAELESDVAFYRKVAQKAEADVAVLQETAQTLKRAYGDGRGLDTQDLPGGSLNKALHPTAASPSNAVVAMSPSPTAQRRIEGKAPGQRMGRKTITMATITAKKQKSQHRLSTLGQGRNQGQSQGQGQGQSQGQLHGDGGGGGGGPTASPAPAVASPANKDDGSHQSVAVGAGASVSVSLEDGSTSLSPHDLEMLNRSLGPAKKSSIVHFNALSPTALSDSTLHSSTAIRASLLQHRNQPGAKNQNGSRDNTESGDDASVPTPMNDPRKQSSSAYVDVQMLGDVADSYQSPRPLITDSYDGAGSGGGGGRWPSGEFAQPSPGARSSTTHDELALQAPLLAAVARADEAERRLAELEEQIRNAGGAVSIRTGQPVPLWKGGRRSTVRLGASVNPTDWLAHTTRTTHSKKLAASKQRLQRFQMASSSSRHGAAPSSTTRAAAAATAHGSEHSLQSQQNVATDSPSITSQSLGSSHSVMLDHSRWSDRAAFDASHVSSSHMHGHDAKKSDATARVLSQSKTVEKGTPIRDGESAPSHVEFTGTMPPRAERVDFTPTKQAGKQSGADATCVTDVLPPQRIEDLEDDETTANEAQQISDEVLAKHDEHDTTTRTDADIPTAEREEIVENGRQEQSHQSGQQKSPRKVPRPKATVVEPTPTAAAAPEGTAEDAVPGTLLHSSGSRPRCTPFH